MAVSVKEKKDNLVTLEVRLAEADYRDKVEQEIKKLAQRASLKGFRAGHTPKALVKKMYGKDVRYDVLQTLISEKLGDFLKEEKFLTIGQPIPLRDLDQSNALDAEEVVFAFELALIPELKKKLATTDTLDYYKPVISDEAVREELRRVMESNKRSVKVDAVEDDDAIVHGNVAELDGDLPKEGGVKMENAYLFPRFMKDEAEKGKFAGATKGTVIIFNPYAAFEGDKAEISSLLGIDRDKVEEYRDKEFSFEITSITSVRTPELDQEFFDQAFEPDAVHSEEEALEQLRKNMEKEEAGNANFKFLGDLKELIRAEKLSDIELAEETIRAWLMTTENGKTITEAEDPEDAFKKMIDSLKEDLFFNEYAKEFDVRVTEEDVKNYAVHYTWQQFANMGWPNVPKEILEKQAGELMDNQNFVYGAEQDILRQIVATKIRENGTITVVEKETTPDELHKLILPETPADAPEVGDQSEI